MTLPPFLFIPFRASSKIIYEGTLENRYILLRDVLKNVFTEGFSQFRPEVAERTEEQNWCVTKHICYWLPRLAFLIILCIIDPKCLCLKFIVDYCKVYKAIHSKVFLRLLCFLFHLFFRGARVIAVISELTNMHVIYFVMYQ
eukprot:GHVU01012039.1.p1 GENE.GHVU01012039.1~~GHVU01012039.1.p1  ORF type:complete len:142 (+),score=4.68 GHVU01012039.1:89-514(+)